MNQFWIKLFSVPLFVIALVSCPNDTATSIKITGIDATATPATITSAATSSLTATVSGTGAFNAGVNWSIASGGGNLSASTGANVTYTAPSVTSSTTVQIKVTAAGDSSMFKTVTITVQPATATPKPIINAFSATPSSLTAAGQVTLIWDVSNATSLSVDSGVGAVTGTSKVVSVASSTAFTLTATNANGSSTSTVTVTVAALPAPPTVVSVSPADGSTGVAADAKIVVTFSKPMDQAATQMAYQSTSLPPSAVSFTWDASGTVLTLKPNAPLESARGSSFTIPPTTYAFTLSATAKDKSGAALAPLTSKFTTLRVITLSLVSDAGRGGSVFSDGYTITGETAFISVGDGSDKVASRGFVSFDFSSVPSNRSGSELSRATLKLFKDSVSGDPYQNLALSCDPDVQCDQYASVNLDHVDYGPSLGLNDFYTPTLKALGVIDTRFVGLETYARADVLAAVRDDLNNRDIRENRSQYRLSFSVLTDGGNAADKVFFLTEKPAESDKRPLLILEYRIP